MHFVKFMQKNGHQELAVWTDPAVGLKAFIAIHDTTLGPALGGTRIWPYSTDDEAIMDVLRLSKAMSYKSAAAGLPLGGGKAVIIGDPTTPDKEKERLIRGMASALSNIKEHIMGPDMGTNEQCMAWFKEEAGQAVGLPRELGGIPLDEIGATGFGVACSARVAAEELGFSIEGARVVVQGFGAVGYHAARFLTEKGAVLVGACDSKGAVYNPDGLDVAALFQDKKAGKKVAQFKNAQAQDRDSVIDMECDIWIPAARPDVININNVARLKTKLVVCGANIPITPDAEQQLHKNGVLCIPDLIANAGGVISAAMEYKGANETAVLRTIEEKITTNTAQILARSKSGAIAPRQAALDIATTRVKTAMGLRRWSVF